VSQGHIGRARYMATNEQVRNHRSMIMSLPLHLSTIADAYKAAQTLVDMATAQAKTQAEVRDEKEIESLQEAYGKGATGRGMATGGAKAVKELEKEQKSRTTRMVRDSIDGALLDITTFFRDVMMVQAGATDHLINTDMTDTITAYAQKTTPHSTVRKVNAIMKARTHLSHNAAPLLTCEALMCQIAN
jgi:DNA polymerase-3 subunit delta'